MGGAQLHLKHFAGCGIVASTQAGLGSVLLDYLCYNGKDKHLASTITVAGLSKHESCDNSLGLVVLATILSSGDAATEVCQVWQWPSHR